MAKTIKNVSDQLVIVDDFSTPDQPLKGIYRKAENLGLNWLRLYLATKKQCQDLI
jgi:hypothetical protein